MTGSAAVQVASPKLPEVGYQTAEGHATDMPWTMARQTLIAAAAIALLAGAWQLAGGLGGQGASDAGRIEGSNHASE